MRTRYGLTQEQVARAAAVRQPELPWRGMLDQRNFLAHAYADVDSKRLWLTLTRSIPDLARTVASIRGA